MTPNGMLYAVVTEFLMIHQALSKRSMKTAVRKPPIKSFGKNCITKEMLVMPHTPQCHI